MGASENHSQNVIGRNFVIAFLVVIAVASSLSAYFAMKAGYPTRAASVFLAGVTFVLIVLSARLKTRS